MANKPKAGGKPSARAALAAAQKAARKAEAEVARLSAEIENEDDEDQEGVEAVEGDDDEDQEGVEAVDGDDDEDEDGQTEAKKIAGSAEAVANPKAATAAIASGMTFAQFKGQVRAQGGGGRRLASVLGGSPRLGADAKGGGGRDKGLDPSAIYKRRANRARPQST